MAMRGAVTICGLTFSPASPVPALTSRCHARPWLRPSPPHRPRRMPREILSGCSGALTLRWSQGVPLQPFTGVLGPKPFLN